MTPSIYNDVAVIFLGVWCAAGRKRTEGFNLEYWISGLQYGQERDI